MSEEKEPQTQQQPLDEKQPQQQPQQEQQGCPFASRFREMKSPHPIPLKIVSGTHTPSQPTKALLHGIGGVQTLRDICAAFYAKAFEDATLKTFMFETDGAVAHGERLGNWIAEKMSGNANLWTNVRPPNSRSGSHAKAWYSPNRPESVRGRRFKVFDVRIWMRVMFWAARECGMHQHTQFWNWYIKFIAHFARIYDSHAPPYAKQDSEWSANPDNIEQYIQNNRRMTDVLSKLH